MPACGPPRTLSKSWLATPDLSLSFWMAVLILDSLAGAFLRRLSRDFLSLRDPTICWEESAI